MTEPEQQQERSPIGTAIRDAIQGVFNDYGVGQEAHLVGDFILLAECHFGEGMKLRIATAEDMPPWRQAGLLSYALSDLNAEQTLGCMVDECDHDDDDELPA